MALWRRLFSVDTPNEWRDSFATLEREFLDIKAEWLDRQDKFNRLYHRIKKQIERDEPATPATPERIPLRAMPPSRRGF